MGTGSSAGRSSKRIRFPSTMTKISSCSMRVAPIHSGHMVIARTGRGYWPGDSVGDGTVDDAGADARRKPSGRADVGELAGDVLAVLAGPGEEAPGVVG